MDGENPGVTGGIKEHNHTYDDLPLHTHTINDPGHKHKCKLPYPPDMSKLGHMPIPDYYDGSGYTSVSYTGITLNYNGTNNCMTYPASSLPPYFKLAFIMTNDSIIKKDNEPPDESSDEPPPDESKDDSASISGYIILLTLSCVPLILFLIYKKINHDQG